MRLLLLMLRFLRRRGGKGRRRGVYDRQLVCEGMFGGSLRDGCLNRRRVRHFN